MPTVRIKWYGAQMTRVVRGRLNDRLDECGEILKNAIIDSIATPVFPRSRPGDPPHLETGELIQSIKHENSRSELTTRVGSDLVNARYLEFGTGIYTRVFGGPSPTPGSSRHMQPRPFIRPAFFARFGTFRVVLFRPIF